MKVSKQGSTLSGVMDAFGNRREPRTPTRVPWQRSFENIRICDSSRQAITDDPEGFAWHRVSSNYIFRRLAVDYLPLDTRIELGILSTGERTQPTLPG